METFNNLPVIQMGIDETLQDVSGVEFVALVAKPAIQRSFLKFKDQPRQLRFAITEDRRIVSGPVMLADIPIYRCPPETPVECYLKFSAPVIEQVVKKFAALGNHANVNLSHDPEQAVKDVVMFESWIYDPARGTRPLEGYDDAPAGSWFGSWHVNNAEVWDLIKSGEFTGFSVEGLFIPTSDVPQPSAEEQLLAQITEILKNC